MGIIASEEEALLFGAAYTSPQAKHLEAIVITAINTGMKRGEIRQLRRKHLNFQEGNILAEKTKNHEMQENSPE